MCHIKYQIVEKKCVVTNAQLRLRFLGLLTNHSSKTFSTAVKTRAALGLSCAALAW